MALVSLRNFGAPFSNRMHMGLIVFTVALFAAFRAAGGALSFTVTAPRAAVNAENSDESFDEEAPARRGGLASRTMPSSLDEISPARELSKLGLDSDRAARPAPSARQEDNDSDLLGDMVQPQRAPAKQAKPQDDIDLDEVERRLGLR
jgi:hypothetical protein